LAVSEGDGYKIVHGEEMERTGGWRLVRRSLQINSFGVNLVDIPPGESIPEHDELERDQEELFVALSGLPAVLIISAPSTSGYEPMEWA
jgi:hypothetical protein